MANTTGKVRRAAKGRFKKICKQNKGVIKGIVTMNWMTLTLLNGLDERIVLTLS
jgi:hypothetical protein